MPFYWHGDVVGYTGRLFDTRNKEIKYYTETQPGYVFNMDAQDWQRKFVLVMEGPFDAITLGGVAILGSEINNTQRELIQGLNRQVIVVPDRDQPGQKLIDQAKEFGWSVAFPQWHESVVDVAEAVLKYGRLLFWFFWFLCLFFGFDLYQHGFYPTNGCFHFYYKIHIISVGLSVERVNIRNNDLFRPPPDYSFAYITKFHKSSFPHRAVSIVTGKQIGRAHV